MGTTTNESAIELTRLEEESIDYFVPFVQMFGLPKSIGQIYGLLFVSPEALPMVSIQARLGISKGSLSQGLSLLKDLGAVTLHSLEGDRREHYRADLEVSRITNHFFENRLEPRLQNGRGRLSVMMGLIDESLTDTEDSTEVKTRVAALQKWHKRGGSIIPMIMRWLKR